MQLKMAEGRCTICACVNYEHTIGCPNYREKAAALICRRRDKEGNLWQEYPLRGHLVSHTNNGPAILFDIDGRWAVASDGGSIEITGARS